MPKVTQAEFDRLALRELIEWPPFGPYKGFIWAWVVKTEDNERMLIWTDA